MLMLSADLVTESLGNSNNTQPIVYGAAHII